MFCFNCGKEIDDNSSFCQHCGTKIKSTENHKTDKDTTILDLEYNKIRKNMVFAYAYWLICGLTGLQRFYLGQYWFCVVYWLLILLFPFADEILYIMLVVWIIDGLLLWQGVIKYNDELKDNFDNNKLNNMHALNIGCLASFFYFVIVLILFVVYIVFLNLLSSTYFS